MLDQLKEWIKSGFRIFDVNDDDTQTFSLYPYTLSWFPYTRIKWSHPEIIEDLVESLKKAYSLIQEIKQRRDSSPQPKVKKISNDSPPKRSLSAIDLTKGVVPGKKIDNKLSIGKQQYELKDLFATFLATLERIAVRNHDAMMCIMEILTQEVISPVLFFPRISKEKSHLYLLKILRNIAQDDKKIIQSISELLINKGDEIRLRAAEIVLEIDPENLEGISYVKDLAGSSDKEKVLQRIPYLFSKFNSRVHTNKK